MRFKFKAIKKDGDKYEGLADAKSKFALYNDLKAEGTILISAEEVGGGKLHKILNSNLSIFSGVKTVDKISLAKNLSGMLKSGLALSRALSVIERQSKKGTFQDIVVGLNSEIKAGKTLSESLKKYPKVFSNLFVSMTKAGEESGTLADALANISSQMEKTYRLQKKVKGALIYPGVILSVMIVVGILMFIFVVPGITATFKELGTELPLSTQIIISISDFFSNNLLLAIAIIIILIGGLIFAARTKAGRYLADNIFVRLPIIGELIKEANSARTARTLSALLLAGVPVAESISITKDTLNSHLFRNILEEAATVVEKGENISTVIMKYPKLYPTYVGEMISVGEETGKVAEMLAEVAIFYENDVEERTKDLSTIIEPILMVIIGAAVAFFALSMITPIYSVMDQV